MNQIRGQVNERLNIILVDPQYISKPVPHDNKLVNHELVTFPIPLPFARALPPCTYEKRVPRINVKV